MKVALLPITKDRSVAIISDENDNYIQQDNSIKYRNMGKMFNASQINDRFVIVTDSQITVLNIKGDEDFHFPVKWLYPIDGMIQYLTSEKYLNTTT